MAMRGLKTFITDIRNCKTDEEEQRRINKELANIRTNFKDKKLSGYNRKKYVSKLIFMNLAGYQVDFDQDIVEALIRSDKYSEKRIGYLSLSTIIKENFEISKNIYNAVLTDLTKSSEVASCFALHAISLLQNRKIASMVSVTIYEMVLSHGVQFYQKKKASLCLSILVRRFPEVVQSKIWCEQLIQFLSYPHLGVVTSIASTVLVLVQSCPEWCATAIEYSVKKLEKINITNDYPADYLYHQVPAPWLQIKLLRILQYLEPPKDEKTLKKIEDIILSIYKNVNTHKNNLQNYNIINALVIEAVNLSIHLGSLKKIINQTVQILGNYVTSRDVNMQYLGLDAMGHLAIDYDNHKVFHRYKKVFYTALSCPDISIQGRASDLLFTVCSIENAKETVEKLMRLLQQTDSGQRRDLLSKIAVLTEKFATEYTWYVDVMYELIAFSADDIDNNIWKRAIQVILNNEELQQYAVRQSISIINSKSHKNALKLSVYLIGELGHLVSAESACSPMAQLEKLQDAISLKDSEIGGMAITAIAKMVAHFPEIGEDAIDTLNNVKKSNGIMIQQRINEYIAMIELKNPSLMLAIFARTEIPAELGSSITKQLLRKSKSIGDRRTWVPESRILRSESKELLRANTLKFETVVSPTLDNKAAANVAVEILQSNYNYLLWNSSGTVYNNGEIDISVELQLSPPSATLAVYINNTTSQVIKQFEINTKPFTANSVQVNATANNTETDIESLSIIREDDYDESLYAGLSLLPGIPLERLFKFMCNGVFQHVPSFEIAYDCDSNGTLKTIKFPVPLNFVQFIEPVKLSTQDFLARWKQLQGAPYESQLVFAPNLQLVDKYDYRLPTDNGTKQHHQHSTKKAVAKNESLESEVESISPFIVSDKSADANSAGLNQKDNNKLATKLEQYLQLVKVVFESIGLFEVNGVDPDPENYVGVGVATTNDAGRFGTLVRFEFDSTEKMVQLTVRATSSEISTLLTKNFSLLFGK